MLFSTTSAKSSNCSFYHFPLTWFFHVSLLDQSRVKSGEKLWAQVQEENNIPLAEKTFHPSEPTQQHVKNKSRWRRKSENINQYSIKWKEEKNPTRACQTPHEKKKRHIFRYRIWCGDGRIIFTSTRSKIGKSFLCFFNVGSNFLSDLKFCGFLLALVDEILRSAHWQTLCGGWSHRCHSEFAVKIETPFCDGKLYTHKCNDSRIFLTLRPRKMSKVNT